jgi:hypothetical protein
LRAALRDVGRVIGFDDNHLSGGHAARLDRHISQIRAYP